LPGMPLGLKEFEILFAQFVSFHLRFPESAQLAQPVRVRQRAQYKRPAKNELLVTDLGVVGRQVLQTSFASKLQLFFSSLGHRPAVLAGRVGAKWKAGLRMHLHGQVACEGGR
jgi:hypothetical protein